MQKVIACLVSLAALATAVPLPDGRNPFGARQGAAAVAVPAQFRQQSSNARPIDNQVQSTPELTGIISQFLPNLAEAVTSNEGTPIDRTSKLTLGFLPLTRAVIDARARSSSDFDKDYALSQQEQAEKILPGIMNAVAKLINSAPPATTLAPIVLPEIPQTPVFDSPYVPDQTIKGFKIARSEFVPEIVIPDIHIQ